MRAAVAIGAGPIAGDATLSVKEAASGAIVSVVMAGLVNSGRTSVGRVDLTGRTQVFLLSDMWTLLKKSGGRRFDTARPRSRCGLLFYTGIILNGRQSCARAKTAPSRIRTSNVEIGWMAGMHIAAPVRRLNFAP